MQLIDPYLTHKEDIKWWLKVIFVISKVYQSWSLNAINQRPIFFDSL